jgi:hypothetical protein
MAVRNDNDLPELVPFDDRLPSRAGLFRRAEEITDDQFVLLAAEWAEGESSADALSEIETIFTASPERRALAEDFKRIRLVPGNEEWPGREAMIKTTSSAFYFNRIIYAALASAAVLLAFLTLSPLIRTSVSQSSPAILPEAAITASAISPSGDPDQVNVSRTVTVIQPSATAVATAEKLQADAAHNPRTEPLVLRNNPETLKLIAGISTAELTAVERMPLHTDIRSLPGEAREANWIMRGITALSGIVTGKDKPVDGYMIAGACVKGVNSVLGWDMDLERVVSEEGNPLAVNFSSSLISFSAPVKKSTDEP